MWTWFNDRLLEEDKLVLHPSNRAFQYGDGIFETMIIVDGNLQLAPYHESRIKASCSLLKLKFKLSFTELQKRINFLLEKNKLKAARVKLSIWRKAGGLYIPEHEETEFLITIKPFEAPDPSPQRVRFSNEVRIPKSITKNCKTLSALPYVLAGLELKNYPDTDDLILLDAEDNISECISSNLFWIRDSIYYTPDLASNCVMGVKRASIIDVLEKKGIKVKQVLASKEDLLQADAVFKTNVTGVYPIRSIEGHTFEVKILL